MLIKIVDKEGKTDDVLGEEVTSGEKSLSEREGTGSRPVVERSSLRRRRNMPLLKEGRQST